MANTMGIVALAFLAAKHPGLRGDDDVNFETDQLGCKVRQPFELPFRISVLNDNVFPFDIAKLAQPLAKCFDPGRIEGRGGPEQNSYPGNSRRLLRLATAPHIVSVRTRATIPAHFSDFGFWILDYRIRSHDCFPNYFCSCLSPQSKIGNLKSKIHLMTRSARASTFGGIVTPICLAVLRLTRNSNFVGCSTGMSAGLAPLRILSTKSAARRHKSV